MSTRKPVLTISACTDSTLSPFISNELGELVLPLSRWSGQTMPLRERYLGIFISTPLLSVIRNSISISVRELERSFKQMILPSSDSESTFRSPQVPLLDPLLLPKNRRKNTLRGETSTTRSPTDTPRISNLPPSLKDTI